MVEKRCNYALPETAGEKEREQLHPNDGCRRGEVEQKQIPTQIFTRQNASGPKLLRKFSEGNGNSLSFSGPNAVVIFNYAHHEVYVQKKHTTSHFQWPPFFSIDQLRLRGPSSFTFFVNFASEGRWWDQVWAGGGYRDLKPNYRAKSVCPSLHAPHKFAVNIKQTAPQSEEAAHTMSKQFTSGAVCLEIPEGCPKHIAMKLACCLLLRRTSTGAYTAP